MKGDTNMKHEIITFNASGKTMYSAKFATAEKAYKEFTETVENLSAHLPKGYEATVVRYNDGRIMSMTTIVGTK